MKSPALFALSAFLMVALGACGLPKGGGQPASTAFKGGKDTLLGTLAQPLVASHPGQSGLHALANARDAFMARLVLADAAQHSLDVQYYIWNDDTAGKVFIERIFRAADRGVRVRLLLDDVGTRRPDDILLTIDSHPNIEVRMFNPVKLRSPRTLGMIVDLARINKRMHNKSFIADGQIAIVGGRNIGDEYFGLDAGANFADLDVAVIGPVVNETSNAFDLYWNHAAAVPETNLARERVTPEQYAAKRAALGGSHAAAERSEYADSLRHSEFARQLRDRSVTFSWGKSRIVRDSPDKVLSSSARTEMQMARELREVVDHTTRELFIISPYFVPGKDGVALLSETRRRGVRVVVITNSLASTDGVPVHSGYQRYRKPLLEAGIELYEIKPRPDAGQSRHSGSFFRFSAGSSSDASLHAKTFSFDRQLGFVGSYNVDPRSKRLNTEMGVLYDCPELARRLPETIERDLDQSAYRVELDGRHLVWITHDGSKEVRYTSEPETGFGKRFKVFLFSLLPIENQL
jgi:putative cardiolipin synthase